MNYCEKIRQSMIDGDDDSVVKYIKKSLLSGYNPKYILKNILIDALSLIAKKEERNEVNKIFRSGSHISNTLIIAVHS